MYNVLHAKAKVQSVLNNAVRLIGGIPKFSHLSSFIRNYPHWLPIRQRIQFKICSLVRNCLTVSASQYLNAYCIPVSSIPSRSALWSSAWGHLVVPRKRTSMAQSRSFAIVGPSNWNKGPSIKYVTLFLANSSPPPLSHFVTH